MEPVKTFTELTADTIITTPDIIRNLIVTHDRASKLEAKEYYENREGANNFLKKLIRQKINYLLGKPISVDKELELDFDDFLKPWGREASIQGVSWLHVYVDGRGQFATRVIPGHEIIPIYDPVFNTDIVEIIRYYQIEVIRERGGMKVLRTRAEVWDSEKVTYYQEDDEGMYALDFTVLNPVYHFTKASYLLNKVFKVDKSGWGAPPFVPLYNNDERASDFADIRTLVKAYDSVLDNFNSNIEALQDSLLLIKDKSYTQYAELLELIKEYKILPVEETGDAKYLTLDIPTEAREKILSIYKTNIYEFGMGVDTRKLADGSALTNYVVKARMIDLDMKANEFAAELNKAIAILLNFYNSFKNRTSITVFKKKNNEVDISFNKNILINETEILTAMVPHVGLVSRETWLKNHPWVTDVAAEMERLDHEELGFGGSAGTSKP
jgi:SPP1 family phage portal protein